MMNSNGFSDFINPETLTLYANTNEELLNVKPKGIIIEFPGLGGGSCLGGTPDMASYSTWFATYCAERGIILAYLFPGPWSWGNKGASRMADAVALALSRKYNKDDSLLALAVMGGSMGGTGVLNYAADTSLPLVACASACPCVDVMRCFDCHPSFPRTFVSSVASYGVPLKEALLSISPVERVAEMPHVPYFITSDEMDSIFPEEQCDSYVSLLRAKGHSVIYHRQPKQQHGQFYPEIRRAFLDFLVDAVLNAVAL